MPPISSERRLLILVLLAYLVVGTLFAVRTPAWQAPDEPAHYNYVAQVAQNGCCPLLEAGDWDSPYLEQLKAARFPAELLGDLPAIQYEDHQPPLYYVLASVVFRFTNGSLTALRLFSLLIGAGVVFGTYAVSKALLPYQPQIALGAAALVAFLPQHVAMLASVNNDSLAEALVAATLWLTIRTLKRENANGWVLGGLVGLALLTKINTIFLVGIVPLAILLKWWNTTRRDLPELLRRLALFAVPVLLISGVWWVRNVDVYGFPDVFGLGQHDRVVADQARTAERIAEIGFSEYLGEAVTVTFNSFWGQFGWMGLPLQPWMYTVIAVVLVVAVAGLVIGMFPPEPDRAAQRAAWLVLALTGLAALAQYVYYNLEFLQLQGRYLYPGLIPFAIAVARGLDGWRRWLLGTETTAPPFRRYLGVAVIALLIPFDLYLVWRVIPGLAP